MQQSDLGGLQLQWTPKPGARPNDYEILMTWNIPFDTNYYYQKVVNNGPCELIRKITFDDNNLPTFYALLEIWNFTF